MQALRACPAALALALAGACGAVTPSPPDATQVLTTAHFRFEYTDRDAAGIAAIAESAETHHARITSELGVAVMPVVRVTFYRDQTALAAAVRPIVGDIPSWATGLATAADRVHMVSTGPSATTITTLAHEFAHCVTLAINPSFGNRPRWLWESVAIHQAGQRVDPRTVPAFALGQPPSFNELDDMNNQLIYSVGYTMVEFVLATWNRAALRMLIESHGNVGTTLGVTPDEFRQQWFAFVRATYGIGVPAASLASR